MPFYGALVLAYGVKIESVSRAAEWHPNICFGAI